MNGKPKLYIDWCSHEAAKFAVMNWHYSKRMPKSKLAKLGVWENDKFIGSVIFGYGATKNIGNPYGLQMQEVCELTRVALRGHVSNVSRILAISLRILKRDMSGIRLVVSYADSDEGHVGGIYQAGNWVYSESSRDSAIVVNGKKEHRRTLADRYGTNSLDWIRQNVDPNAERIYMGDKHKYLYPLDKEMRKQIEPLAKPYPKREPAPVA